MRRAALVVLPVAACAAPPPPPTPITLQAPYASARFAPGPILAVHNRERAAVGSPPLAWDVSLAQQAAIYAVHLSRLGRLQHSPRARRPGQGENLAMVSSRYYSAEALAGGWVAERRHFRSGTFPNVSRTGNWRDVGHYTQVIWPTTTRVGCGTAQGRGVTFLVCRYAPAGNVDGRGIGL